MIVDDSNIIRNKITRSISNKQFCIVAQAINGREAIDLFYINLPDVITMDLTMPEMDGLDCIQQLVEIKPDVRILVVSALSDKDTGIKALELGAQGFILKPFNEEEISDALSELTENQLND